LTIAIRAQSRGESENIRILGIVREHFAKLQVLVWAPAQLLRDGDAGRGRVLAALVRLFEINSCSKDGEGSFHETGRNASAMFEAVASLCMFVSYRKCLCYAWPSEPGSQGKPPPL
jgi:hypothetical protein